MTKYLKFAFAALLPVAVFGAVPAGAQQGTCYGPQGQVRLTIDVQNVRSSQGQIGVTVYADDRRRFLARRGSLYVARGPARAGTTRMCIYLPRPGTYGLAIYHDANANDRFDRNRVGLPAEGYGFSNNAPAVLGLPSFSAVRMPVPRTNMETSVRLKYP